MPEHRRTLDGTSGNRGINPWEADLLSRIINVWKLNCLKLIAVLVRKNKQMMSFVIGDTCKAHLQKPSMIYPDWEPIIIVQKISVVFLK